MKRSYNIIFSTFVAIYLSIAGCNPFAGSDNDNNNDLLLGLAALSQGSGFRDGSLSFDARFDGKSIECGSQTYTMPGGQIVQMRDFRFFVQDVQFVRSNGTKIPMQMRQVDNWQLREGDNQVALLDFTRVGQGKCGGTSDDEEIRTQIDGRIPNGTFESVEVMVGVPNVWNHIDPSAQPSTSPLKSATGLTWNWLAGYKFIRLELEGRNNTTRMLFHLGSTACNGDTSFPFGDPQGVTCANPYRAQLVLKPEGGFNTDQDTIVLNLDEFFRGNGGVPTSAFDPDAGSPIPLSCMPIGNGGGTGGTPETCGPILRNLGIVPGDTAGFSSALATQTGVGIVDLSTQQSILKVIR